MADMWSPGGMGVGARGLDAALAETAAVAAMISGISVTPQPGGGVGWCGGLGWWWVSGRDPPSAGNGWYILKHRTWYRAWRPNLRGSVLFFVGNQPPPPPLAPPRKRDGARHDVLVGVGEGRDSGMILVGGSVVPHVRCLWIRTGKQALTPLELIGSGPERRAGGPPQGYPIGRRP